MIYIHAINKVTTGKFYVSFLFVSLFSIDYASMRKILSIFLLLLLPFSLSAEQWHYSRADLTFENDADVRTDRGYTEGAQLSMLMHREDVNDSWFQIPLMAKYQRNHFVSFSIAQQMFTPEDLNATEPVPGDRPYAGWLYAQVGLHQSTCENLDSLSLKLGIVGQHAYMENVQKFIHWLIGSPEPKGWENQIGSKVGIQLDYQHKWRYLPPDLWVFESDFIPYVSGELGNISIKASVGASWRVGYNIPHDFGDSPIDEYGDNGVPTSVRVKYAHKSKWSYYFNFGVGGSYVLYDIFLDGRTLNGDEFVHKYSTRAFGNYGASLRYGNFALSYIRTHYTPEYTTQEEPSSFGSLLFVYRF